MIEKAGKCEGQAQKIFEKVEMERENLARFQAEKKNRLLTKEEK